MGDQKSPKAKGEPNVAHVGKSKITGFKFRPFLDRDDILASFWVHLHPEDEKNWNDFRFALVDEVWELEPDLKKYDFEFKEDYGGEVYEDEEGKLLFIDIVKDMY